MKKKEIIKTLTDYRDLIQEVNKFIKCFSSKWNSHLAFRENYAKVVTKLNIKSSNTSVLDGCNNIIGIHLIGNSHIAVFTSGYCDENPDFVFPIKFLDINVFQEKFQQALETLVSESPDEKLEKISQSNLPLKTKVEKAISILKKEYVGIQLVFKINKFLKSCKHEEKILIKDVTAKYVSVSYDCGKRTTIIKSFTILL